MLSGERYGPNDGRTRSSLVRDDQTKQELTAVNLGSIVRDKGGE
jgi:hypothetical protein